MRKIQFNERELRGGNLMMTEGKGEWEADF